MSHVQVQYANGAHADSVMAVPQIRGLEKANDVWDLQKDSPTGRKKSPVVLHDLPGFEDEAGGRVVLFTFFSELAEPVKKLGTTAWAARGKLARDVKAYIVVVTGTIYSMPGRVVKVVNNPALRQLLAEEEDPQALAAVVCGCSGGVLVGSLGGVVGATVGGATGLVIGTVPALLTFGLSLPIGAAIGGVFGTVAGTACGGSAGLAGGATSGVVVAYFKDDIKLAALNTCAFVYDAYDLTVVRPVAMVKSGASRTKEKARRVRSALGVAASDPRVHAAMGSAAVGAAAAGTAGAAGGALVGGGMGALVGLVPAVFTFGLSIPIGAMVGGGAGLCIGGAAGTATGFAGGGVVGAVGYSCRSAPILVWNGAVGLVRGATGIGGGRVTEAMTKEKSA